MNLMSPQRSVKNGSNARTAAGRRRERDGERRACGAMDSANADAKSQDLNVLMEKWRKRENANRTHVERIGTNLILLDEIAFSAPMFAQPSGGRASTRGLTFEALRIIMGVSSRRSRIISYFQHFSPLRLRVFGHADREYFNRIVWPAPSLRVYNFSIRALEGGREGAGRTARKASERKEIDENGRRGNVQGATTRFGERKRKVGYRRKQRFSARRDWPRMAFG